VVLECVRPSSNGYECCKWDPRTAGIDLRRNELESKPSGADCGKRCLARPVGGPPKGDSRLPTGPRLNAAAGGAALAWRASCARPVTSEASVQRRSRRRPVGVRLEEAVHDPRASPHRSPQERSEHHGDCVSRAFVPERLAKTPRGKCKAGNPEVDESRTSEEVFPSFEGLHVLHAVGAQDV